MSQPPAEPAPQRLRDQAREAVIRGDFELARALWADADEIESAR
jgi:hypothetical protein